MFWAHGSAVNDHTSDIMHIALYLLIPYISANPLGYRQQKFTKTKQRSWCWQGILIARQLPNPPVINEGPYSRLTHNLWSRPWRSPFSRFPTWGWGQVRGPRSGVPLLPAWRTKTFRWPQQCIHTPPAQARRRLAELQGGGAKAAGFHATLAQARSLPVAPPPPCAFRIREEFYSLVCSEERRHFARFQNGLIYHLNPLWKLGNTVCKTAQINEAASTS